MNKSELVRAVASDAGVSKAEAEGVLSSFFDTVRTQLAEGGSVGWPGFGKFTPAARQARTGRNPQTGASVAIPASTAARFTPSSLLKSHLNPAPPAGEKSAGKKSAAKTSTAKKATKEKAPAKKAPASKGNKKAPASKGKRTSR